MKLSSINSINNNHSNINNKNTSNAQNVQFRGIAGSLTNFWQFVDNGGRALQFTVEDMFGTNFWRTGAGLFAGYEDTHKLNWLGALSEGIREFMTGPLMCLTPVAVLNLAIKLTGKTADTRKENIENLSYLMSQAKDNAKEGLDKSFYETTVIDMLQKTTGRAEIDKEHVNKLVEGMQKYKACTDKKESKKLLASLQETFENIIKSTKENYQGSDFLGAKYSISQTKQGQTGFKDYVGYINAYIDDFTKRFGNDAKNITNDTINAFKRNFVGKRVLTAASMFFGTMVVLSQIPKIYTKATGKINPTAAAVYDQANKKGNCNNNDKKEVK